MPQDTDLGAFGVKRKYDVHTGVDLYCEEGDFVYAIEAGVVIAIQPFTGPSVGLPWWNDTSAVAIKGASGIIVYGEIDPFYYMYVGDTINEGDILGRVIPVLKTDKSKVPSTTMLHIELYSSYTGKWAEWPLGESKPNELENPTGLLISQL